VRVHKVDVLKYP